MDWIQLAQYWSQYTEALYKPYKVKYLQEITRCKYSQKLHFTFNSRFDEVMIFFL